MMVMDNFYKSNFLATTIHFAIADQFIPGSMDEADA